jgi:glycosyltransferase involved in cell wall biosynthesis
MKICFLVDGRSTIAINWIRYFIRRGYEIHVISSHVCNQQSLEGATVHQVPIAFGGIARENGGGAAPSPRRPVVASALRRIDYLTKGLIRSWFTPLDLLPHINRVRRLCNLVAPDLVHAMRIPYEGIMAAMAVQQTPLLISCWGNDFTLFTGAAPDRFLTRRAMRRADALHCDCERDVTLACRWGFDPNKPSIVLPGAGGVDTSVFHPGQPRFNGWHLEVSGRARIVINPRGMRTYVRNDTFFRSIPLILREHPNAVFLCPGMQGEPFAEKAVHELSVGPHVRLLPTVSREKLAELFRAAEVSVSPTTHDGTPNTLLEAMASGCFPVAGDIESVREWIDDGINGLLCDPASSNALAAAISLGLRDDELRRRAAANNVRLVRERAEYGKVMATADAFYRDTISGFWLLDGNVPRHSRPRASRMNRV